MKKTFTCFSDKKLYAKKEWVLPNNVVFLCSLLLPFILMIYSYCLYSSFTRTKWIYLPFIFLVALYLADLITGIIHCLYIDGSYNYNKFDKENNCLIVVTNFGYASCHHLFPSNWKDIPDKTIIINSLVVMLIPLLFSFYFINIPLLKCLLILTTTILVFCPLPHKYAHEKLHGRPIPYIANLLIENNIILNPKSHEKHHIENNYNWSFLNGYSDSLLNFIIKNICYHFEICPKEELQYNTEMFKKDIINIRFVGDIEGTIQCRMDGHLFVEP